MSARDEGRLLRCLTWLWPADLRRAHGEEAVADYIALRAERGGDPMSAARFWVWVLMDVLATAVAARGPGGGGRVGARLRRASWLRSAGWTADVRQGFRQVAGAPGFSWSMVLTLALGIGATTAVFSSERTRT